MRCHLNLGAKVSRSLFFLYHQNICDGSFSLLVAGIVYNPCCSSIIGPKGGRSPAVQIDGIAAIQPNQKMLQLLQIHTGSYFTPTIDGDEKEAVLLGFTQTTSRMSFFYKLRILKWQASPIDQQDGP